MPNLNKITVSLNTKELNTTYSMTPEVKEELSKLFGAELSESEGDKISTIFESAVNAKVKSLIPGLEKQFNNQVMHAVGVIKEDLDKSISGYLSYVVEEWFDENKQALQSNLQDQRNNVLVEEMQKVFAKHYVSVPKEGKSLLEGLEKKAKRLERELGEANAKGSELRQRLNGAKCEKIFNQLSEGLAQTEREKFMSLVEDLDIDSPKTFESKAKIIREAHFKKGAKTVTESLDPAGKAAKPDASKDKPATAFNRAGALGKSKLA